MASIKLNINGYEVTGSDGQTILDIAKENGIDIPTLCHDERVQMYGSCGLCIVEAEGIPKLLRSCSTYANDGMIIKTDTPRIRDNRKAALELLLSDHTGDCRPPCTLVCPAQTDCQGYVGLIANGEYSEAVKLIKDKIPLPSSIGRVCPHPCEDACRRKLVEEPISIKSLKQFVGDLDLANPFTANIESGKSVAVIGGGPGGLSAAYFLRTQGHDVTVYDAMPHMGGMLRYGIPEYRLPKEILQKEIDSIEKMNVKFLNNVKIGRDLTLDHLRNTYDAVIIAVGAWSSTELRCPGEDLQGVLGGIDFLRDVALNNPPDLTGRKVAVVGGGNTAMDACRTALRLGAGEVYNIYRRTRNEMPAEEDEINEALDEGVIFKNLTNPIEIIGENGKVKAVRLQIMELGEPDASGRRSPVPVAGKEETIEADMVVVAIGQKLSPGGFEDIDKTKRQTIIADEHTFRTNLDGVFAIGDATNKGADIAISAIGEAKKASEMVTKYLNGEKLNYEIPYFAKTDKTAQDFADRTKESRVQIPLRPANERRNDFLEINSGFSEEDAKKEASRCLECGCQDYFECKLVDYANQYSVAPEKYSGKVHNRANVSDHPFIHRNEDKCILCGLCVRICDEAVGATALGLVNRGFDTIVRPALEMELRDTDCISCGQCVHACPTGALTETKMMNKQVPLRETVTDTVCSFCSVGCRSKLTSNGNLLMRNLPEKDGLLCMKGRFGFGEIAKKERLTYPLLRTEKGLTKTTFEEAISYTNKRLQDIKSRYGENSVAVAISERYTNEEAFLIKEYAEKALKTNKIFSFGQVNSGLADVLGRDASTATFNDINNAELIVVINHDLIKNHGVAGMKIKRAVNKGAKLLLLSNEDSLLNGIADLHLSADTATLKQIAKSLILSSCGKDIEGFGELNDSLKDISVSESSQAAAEMIRKFQNVVFIFERNAVTQDGTRLIAVTAALSGHIVKSGSGIIALLPGANSQGLINLDVTSGEDYSFDEIRGLFIFGEDISGIDLSKLDFLAVQDLHMTETAMRSNVVFPASSFAEVNGSFTGADGMVREIKPAVAGPLNDWDNSEQIIKLSLQAGVTIDKNLSDIKQTINQAFTLNTIRLAVPGSDILFRSECPTTNSLCANLIKFAADRV